METGGVLSRRDLLKAAAALALPAWLAACAKKAGRKTLNFFNWSDYIGEKTIPGFEAETGIKVVQDLFSDEEEMFAKLKTGVQGYDLTIATDYMIGRLKALNIIQPFPEGTMRNLGNLSERFRNPSFDPGLRFTIPYLWGTTGIAYSRKHFKTPPASWKDLWNEAHAGKIGMLDNARDSVGMALFALGLPSDSADPEHLKKAEDLLVKQKRLIKHYSSSTYIDELASGELWIAAAWSGDALQAARENPEIDYVVPKEGSWIWVDSVTLISGSDESEEAVRFVDYLLRPEVAAEIAETVRYATPNDKALPLLSDGLRKDPRVFPPADVMKRLKFRETLDDKGIQAVNGAWQRVKLT